jgi:hypothetical protein
MRACAHALFPPLPLSLSHLQHVHQGALRSRRGRVIGRRIAKAGQDDERVEARRGEDAAWRRGRGAHHARPERVGGVGGGGGRRGEHGGRWGGGTAGAGAWDPRACGGRAARTHTLCGGAGAGQRDSGKTSRAPMGGHKSQHSHERLACDGFAPPLAPATTPPHPWPALHTHRSLADLLLVPHAHTRPQENKGRVPALCIDLPRLHFLSCGRRPRIRSSPSHMPVRIRLARFGRRVSSRWDF